MVLILLLLVSLFIGRYPNPGFTNPFSLFAERISYEIFFNLRFPRILIAILGGAVLGASGFVFQMIFSNPLVEPGFLGVSQGAAFGAAAAILFLDSTSTMIQLSATFFALLGLFLSYNLAKRFHFGGWILRLILAGIAVSALFSSGVGFLKYIADPLSQLPELTFWLLGSLANSTWGHFFSVLPICIISLSIVYVFRWRLNILSLHDRSAFSLGISPYIEKLILLFLATASTAAIISISGLIGWIGLIIPHLSRKIFSSNSRFALPGSMILGSIYMLICDTTARTLLSGEIPIGILTSFFGAFLFIIILTRKHSGEAL
ncbi:MAG: iron ABC transporter permease [Spirochaetia bacterium]|nr:iron ABC transporter permease [Spirochaetia bacterium]MCF7946483.1 iron ABC transporter permease [Spirochaetia bacterium]